MSKSKPIPVRFEAEEVAIIDRLAKRAGMTRAEIVRRAVRLLDAEVRQRGQVGFILDLHNIVEMPPISDRSGTEGLRAAEDPPDPKRAPARRASGK